MSSQIIPYHTGLISCSWPTYGKDILLFLLFPIWFDSNVCIGQSVSDSRVNTRPYEDVEGQKSQSESNPRLSSPGKEKKWRIERIERLERLG